MTWSGRSGALALACLGWVACTTRPPTQVHGIELEDPIEEARRKAAEAGTASTDPAASDPAASDTAASDTALIAAPADPVAASSGAGDRGFVYSREPQGELRPGAPQLPIHINESWWPFRARHLGISEAQARKRDAQLSAHPPEDVWDAQTSREAVSVWTVLCNECHGGRRSLEDAREMPPPASGWADREGLFFGKRDSYARMFHVVENGGPVREIGRAGMPAWRNILSREMIWALLYFLEYQSGGIESRFPPSLYPRRPEMLGKP